MGLAILPKPSSPRSSLSPSPTGTHTQTAWAGVGREDDVLNTAVSQSSSSSAADVVAVVGAEKLWSMVFQLPLMYHALNFAFFFGSVAILRFKPIRMVLTRLTSNIPLGYYGTKTLGKFEELSLFCWIVHYTPLAFTLELIGGFLRLMRINNNNDGIKVGNTNNSNKRGPYEVARVHAFTHLITHVSSVLAVLSHSLVGVDGCGQFEAILVDWFFWMLQIHTYSVGLAMIINSIVGTYIPIAILTVKEILLFHNMPGIALSSLSWIKILSSKHLSVGFKLGWSILSVTPFAFPDSSTDWGHTKAATLLGVAACIQSIGTNYDISTKMINQDMKK